MIENGRRVTRTEKTTIDGSGRRVTEVTEKSDDGRGNVNSKKYMIEGDGNKPKKSKTLKR